MAPFINTLPFPKKPRILEKKIGQMSVCYHDQIQDAVLVCAEEYLVLQWYTWI